MKLLAVPLSLAALATLALAFEPYVPPSSKPAAELKPLTAEAAAKALEMLSSQSAQVRDSARTALRKRSLSEETRAQARDLLKQVKSVHKGRLEALVKRGVPAATQLLEMAKAWGTQRDTTMVQIRTDHHKDGAKVAIMTEEHAKTDKLLRVLHKELKGIDAAWKPIADATQPLEEIERDLSLLDGPGSYAARPPQAFLAELGAAKELMDTFAVVKARRDAIAELEAVEKHNEGCKWATKAQKLFAQILNQNRFAVQLQPLRLDERLCQAATDHSQEMIALGYFAHESPVEKNKTPWIRASNAKFEGGCSGENIFAGSASAEAAYGAWWASDGHRFIMFASGPNTAGVGPVASTWTFMTGNKTWNVSARN